MIRALVQITILQFVSMVLLLIRTKVLAVALGPDGVGVLSTVDKLAAVVAQTLSLSLPFAALRFLPAAQRESADQMDVLYRKMRGVLVALLVPATTICMAIAVLSPERWGAALVPHQRTVILALAGLPVVALVPFLTNAYAGIRGHAQAMYLTIGHAAVLLLSAAGAASGLGLAGFYALYATLGLMLVVGAWRKLDTTATPEVGRTPLSVRELLRLPPSLWRFTAWLLPLTFAAPYAAWYVQYSTLRLYGAAASGILQGAIGISLSLRTLLGAASAVFLTPQVNRQADPATRMAWANEFERTTVLILVAALPPLLLFSDVALRILYAAPFAAASAFVALFVAAEVVTLLSGTYQSLIIANDSMAFHVFQNLASYVLMVAVAAFALPRIGIAGAGVAALAMPSFMFVSTLLFLRYRQGVRMSRDAAQLCALAAALLIVCGLVGSRYAGLTLATLSGKTATCVAVWMLAFFLTPATDRARVAAALARVTKRRVTGAAAQDGVV